MASEKQGPVLDRLQPNGIFEWGNQFKGFGLKAGGIVNPDKTVNILPFFRHPPFILGQEKMGCLASGQGGLHFEQALFAATAVGPDVVSRPVSVFLRHPAHLFLRDPSGRRWKELPVRFPVPVSRPRSLRSVGIRRS